MIAVCVVLLVVIVLLVRVVINNGVALLRGVGDTPIVSPEQDEEEIWVSPTMNPDEEWEAGDVIPEYVPQVPDNKDFDQSGANDESIPVDSLPEDLVNTTPPPPDSLFGDG